MQLKNKTQREQFLDNYTKWKIWKELPELELKFYRYVFPNGTKIIATEYARMKFSDYRCGHFEYKKTTDVKYCLLLSEHDSFKTENVDTAHKLYSPSGDNKSTIIRYLTETKQEV